MSVRPPQAPDRLSSLSSSLGDSPSERRSPGHRRQPSDTPEAPGLVQRCVIIQRDQHGFGFTVSGDRVVLVQSVRPGGAAMRAGVQEGDRIVKVNGTMVTNSSHLEVVKLIKSGAYVALTLLGSPPGSGAVSGSQQEPEPSGCSQRITEPRPYQDPEVQKHAAQILRNMLRQEQAELQRFQELLQRNPGADVEEQLEGARRRLNQLRLKIQQETHGAADLEAEVFGLPGSGSASPQLPGKFSRNSQDGETGLETAPGETRNSGFSRPGSPRSSPTDQGLGRPQIIGPEEEPEPGGASESDSVFQDLGILKSRPAHLGVFLRFLFSQADPTPLLFHLCSEVCCQQSSPKESRALARDIWNLFLDRNAPLRVKVPEPLLAEIELRVRSGEDARPALQEAQGSLLPLIHEQLHEYRTKRTLGLGGLYGENELQELQELQEMQRELPNSQSPEGAWDGNSQREFRDRERALAERQLGHLGDILSKYEEERSSPMAFALSTFMAHVGMRPREPREPRGPAGAADRLPDRDKWLPFFPKAKKSSSSKKEKEQRQNPILKYIGKPRSSSQSTVKPGNVRTMIQHFENSHGDLPELGSQRLSTGSIPEELLESDSSRCEVRLGRSESLKGREELRRSRRAELVPRSRSDVDMDPGNSQSSNSPSDTPRLHSASSSASSLSNRSLENPTPPYTPKMGRRSMESPSLGLGADPFVPHLLEAEQSCGLEPEADPEPPHAARSCQGSSSQSWQHSVSRELLAGLAPREVDRQEVINELFSTEFSHLRILRVLDLLFYQGLRREQLLSREELGLLFPNLPDLIGVHSSLSESMKRLREEGPLIRHIGDLLLARFEGPAKEEFQRVAATFCSCQSVALELIRTKQRKESRFQLFMQEAESNPQCRRLQLKDLIVSEMQRLTKYPLLLESIIKCTEAGSLEQQKLLRARDQCRDIVRFVNDAVRGAENRRRLQEHQRRLDTSALERTSNPLAAQFRNLDLTSHRMIHEGPLAWRVGKDKSVELHVLLLEELLVLLQRQDERLVLKCHSKGALGASSDTKQSFSPVLKLSSVLVRSVATDKRALFIICTSELGPQIYELVALTSSEKNTWMELLEQAVQGATRSLPGPPKRHQGEAGAGAGLELPERPVSPELGPDTEAEPQECPPAHVADVADVADDVADPPGRAPPLQELPEPPGEPEPGPGIAESIPGLPDSIPTIPGPVPTIPGPVPTIPKSPGSAGVAEAALEDVETLRLLIVRRLRRGQNPNPDPNPGPNPGPNPDDDDDDDDDDDVTPTASGQGWNSRISGRELHTSGWEFPKSGRDSLISSQEFSKSSQEFPKSSQEFPKSSQEFSKSSWDSVISSREFPKSSREFSMSSRDSAMSSQDFPTSSQEFPTSSQDLSLSSQEFPKSSRDSAISSREFSISSQDSEMSSQEFSISSREFSVSSRDSTVSSREFSRSSPEFPKSSREFSTSSQDSVMSSQEFPMSSQEFPKSGPEFPKSTREFSTSSQDSVMSSQEFPMSSQEFPRSGPEFPKSSREFSTSSQDSVMSSQEFPMSSQEFPKSGPEFPKSSREFPKSAREFPKSSWEFSTSSQESAIPDGEFSMSSQEFPKSSPEFPKSSPEFPKSSPELPKSSGDSQEGSREEPERPEPNGIQINRKAQEEGPEEATPPRGCSQSEPELREGGGASAEGNFFYLSLPRGPPRPGGDSGDTPGDTPGDTSGDTRDVPGDIRDTLGDVPGDTPRNIPRGGPRDIRDISGDTPGDTPGDIGDTELILGTLEELRGKLLSLRALEAAHRQLLHSLGGDSATAPGVPRGVPRGVPGRALPPPGPQGCSRGHPGTGSEGPAHL